MTDRDSLYFRNKSISQLVQQLNNLGDDHVAIQQTALYAIQEADSTLARRFRSKSVSKYTPLEQNQPQSQSTQNQRKLEFYLTDNSQKKYYYNEISHQLQTITIGSIMNKFQQGFNTTLVTQYQEQRFKSLIDKISGWFQSQSADNIKTGDCYASFFQYRNKDAVDLLSDKNSTLNLEQTLQKNHLLYQIKINDFKKIKNLSKDNIKIIKLMKKTGNRAQFRMILFPEKFMSLNLDDPALKIVKAQLNQILSYIKTNPQKRYQNIRSLIPKRCPTALAIAQLLLYDSANFVINWILDNQQNRAIMNGRFQFFDKLSSISNLMKKVPSSQSGITESRQIVSKYNPNKRQKSPLRNIESGGIKYLNTMQSQFRKSEPNSNTNKHYMNNTAIIEKNNSHFNYQPADNASLFKYPKSMKQLQYCRTLERKTHKYSISQFESGSEDKYDENEIIQKDIKLFPNDNNSHKINQERSESEAILILKAQHAREISQYHQTIQSLNQKILALTTEKGLQQLYTIHQRQIMHLQLKIEELRKDISRICGNSEKGEKQKDLKSIIKKLNDELSIIQKSSPGYKVSLGKMKMLEKQLEQTRKKYQASEVARKQLGYELEAMTKRLKLQDELSQRQKMMNVEQQNFEQLAPKQQETYSELSSMINDKMKNKDNEKYLLRKCKNILGDLSETREIVLDCNSFLVELQQHIEGKLGEKDPQVVLDCNRFIRAYLLDNLDIF